MVGHIRYANHVHDALLLAGLNGSELHAALVCYRAARGWGGLESEQVPWPMSAGLVVQSTTLKRSVAARALAGLRSKGIIVEHEPSRGPRPALYLFVERPDEWTVDLVSTERDVHGSGHKHPLSGTQASTQRDSGVHSAGQSADESAVQQRNTGDPKTRRQEDIEDNHSARAREAVAIERPEPVATASDRRHKRLQMEAQAAPNGGTSASKRSQYDAEDVDSRDKPQEPAAPEAEGVIPADLRERVVVIQGEIPADPAFSDWESLDPLLIVEVDGRREELDWTAAGLTLSAVLFPPEPEPEPEPERPKVPPIGERVWTALRDDEALHTQWKKRQRVEQVVSWAMQSPENAAQVERVLDAISANVDSPTAFLLSFFTAAGARNSRPLRGRGRRMAAPYTHRR